VFLAHANGFCKEVWGPVVAGLPAAGWKGTITAWDAPGHGGSPALPLPFDWWDMARAALDVISRPGSEGPRFGVGHSMGGANLVMAEMLEPGSLQGLILIEPIIPPPPFRRLEDHPLAIRAMRRRVCFSSRNEAQRNFSSKAAFRSWDAQALRGYVEGGLVERDGRFWLACAPHFEAEIYRSGSAHDTYERLTEVECPVLVLAGEASDTYSEEWAAHLAGAFRNGRLRVIPGTGHFSPMERPDLVARQIADELARQRAS
jgi:pimeloyl-ACP methyl ester carboxylesterase